MPFIDIGQSRMRYDCFGEGTPLVFAHGVGGNRVSWFNQVPRFSANFRVIIFDHRGFGGSNDVEEAGRSRYVDDLLALFDSLEIEQALLVGQSMGGGTCAAFTCRHPERVRGLAIADSLSGLVTPEPLATSLRITRKANSELTQAERVLGPGIRADNPEATLLYLQLASFNSVNAKTVRGEMPPWSAEELAATGVPTLFVVGEHDILFTPEQIGEVQRNVPGSRLVTISDAGHSAYFEQPRAFNEVIESFFDSVGDAS